jgi:hypothetical protein
MRWQTSHWTMLSLWRTFWKTGGLNRTWQTEHVPSRVAMEMATPFR